ncbi:MAG: Crp/Fnr family transcriptional regulator [Firmicutes bacterium HGW-Firmicutes-21]|nr:MAG: Crp/Fnr family transcriptional regulator [Firmicutes bacterium HGW-Firmicutes-21]
MKIIIDKIKSSPLFAGISEKDIESLLGCLKSVVKQYPKGSTIFAAGDRVGMIGVVMSGRVQIIKEDFFGNRSILTEIGEGGLFAETFTFVRLEKLPVTVISVTESEVMFIDYMSIITSCASSCVFHTKLIENMLFVLARKNLVLNRKIEHISERTTREKLLSYLSTQAQQAERNEFRIPFDRQELADYLCVERSAMSAELSKLRREGVLEYKKNWFRFI